MAADGGSYSHKNNWRRTKGGLTFPTARQADPARPTPASSLYCRPTEADETHKQEMVSQPASCVESGDGVRKT